MDVITGLSAWVRPYTGKMGFAMSATLLVIYGLEIGRLLKNRTRRLPFLVRVVLFVLLCSFGYGAATVWLAEGITRLLYRLPDAWLAPAVLVVFTGLGLLAERKRHL